MKNEKKEMRIYWDEGRLSPDFVREMDLDDYPALEQLSVLANGIFELLDIVRQHQEKGWDDDPEFQTLVSYGVFFDWDGNLPRPYSTISEAYRRLVHLWSIKQIIADGPIVPVEFDDV